LWDAVIVKILDAQVWFFKWSMADWRVQIFNDSPLDYLILRYDFDRRSLHVLDFLLPMLYFLTWHAPSVVFPPVFKPGFSTVGESSSSASVAGADASSVVDGPNLLLVAISGEAVATAAAAAVEFAAGLLIQRLFVGLIDLPLKFSKYSS
jgi:hypothetical protein